MASTFTFLFSLSLSIFLLSFIGVDGKIPTICKRLECPQYDVIEVNKDYEIRRYNSTVLISTSPVKGDSLVDATRKGFRRLFSYVNGDNKYKKQIEMTAPVITQVSLGDGGSSFVVSFYVPKDNQANPPPGDGLNVQRLENVHAAVRQFGGFVTDSNIKDQIATLNASLAHSKWTTTSAKGYNVAQFNPPFQFFNRVNELWFLIVPK